MVWTSWLVLYIKTFYFRLHGLASCIWQIHLTKYSPLENLPTLMIADLLLINLLLTMYDLNNIFSIHCFVKKSYVLKVSLTSHKNYIFRIGLSEFFDLASPILEYTNVRPILILLSLLLSIYMSMVSYDHNWIIWRINIKHSYNIQKSIVTWNVQ